MNTPKHPHPLRDNGFPAHEASWAAVHFVRQPHAFVQHAFVILLGVFLIAGGVYSAVAKVSVTVEATGRLVTLDPPVPIRASQKITVEKLLVNENQVVKKGTPLVTSAEALAEKERQKMNAYIASLKRVSQSSAQGSCAGCVAELERQAQVQKSIQVQGEILANLVGVQDAGRELQLALEERSELPKVLSDLNMQLRLDSAKINEIKKRNAQRILAKELEMLETSVVSNRARIYDREQKSEARVKSARQRLTALVSELENKLSYLGKQFVIYAPFDGVVTSLALKGAGEVVQVGQVMLNLVPANSPLVAELEVRNQDITEVSPGMTADIKVDSMPEFEFGALNGKITLIGRRERDPANEAVALTIPKFVVRAELNRQSLSRRGSVAPLVAGMTVKGHIVSREETILHVVIKELFKLKDEMKAAQHE